MEADKRLVPSEMSEEEKQLVENQLATILASIYFNSAKQMKHFLEYVVKKTLVGEGKLLKQYTIGVEALDLPDDFDSDSNPVVRIMGGRVRKRLNEFYNNTDDNKVVITIPKGTYTPDLIRCSVNSNFNRTDFKRESAEIEASSGPKIALVSFTDVTQSKLSNRLLLRTTDCLAKELSNFVLTKFVVFNPYSDKCESSSMHQEIDSVYRLYLYMQDLTKGKYELLCRLTDVKEEVVWSESFEIQSEIPLLDQENIFARIITTIVDIHQGKLLLDWARVLLLNKDNIPDKLKVFAYYRQFYDTLNSETLAKAIEAGESSLERNSDDVIANILMSDLCRRDYVHNFNLIESSLDKGLRYAERAIHLRQDSHEAHFTLGQILFSQGEWDRCLEEFRITRSINKFNAVIEYACGFFFCLMNRWDEGLPLVKKAMNMSNNYPSWYHMILSLAYYREEKYKKALMEAEKIVAPGLMNGCIFRCIAYTQLGDNIKAKRELKEIAAQNPDFEKNGKSIIVRFLGNTEISQKVWDGIQMAIKR
ncbi:MAG: hypothetical protein V7749_01900 [Cocleimonas sp.]